MTRIHADDAAADPVLDEGQDGEDQQSGQRKLRQPARPATARVAVQPQKADSLRQQRPTSAAATPWRSPGRNRYSDSHLQPRPSKAQPARKTADTTFDTPAAPQSRSRSDASGRMNVAQSKRVAEPSGSMISEVRSARRQDRPHSDRQQIAADDQQRISKSRERPSPSPIGDSSRDTISKVPAAAEGSLEGGDLTRSQLRAAHAQDPRASDGRSRPQTVGGAARRRDVAETSDAIDGIEFELDDLTTLTDNVEGAFVGSKFSWSFGWPSDLSY